MRSDTVVGVLPKTYHDLRLLERVEDLLLRHSSCSSARRRPPPCTRRRCSCLAPSEPRSGAASAPPAPRSASVLVSSPTPLVQADPLNQPGPKPAGQVSPCWSTISVHCSRSRSCEAPISAFRRTLVLR